ncbi:CKLF-like MARVEL transmembrane domain-containing protein 4 [Clavelina lepadiformis]|uniref:CKLF-like MARVEL transmembrane domain-containing protein 4 n=1 Tax=Clavelina lepadiformis TaxID=159417 RepID=UPI0040434B0B
MSRDTHEQHDDDFTAVDASMISSTSPYQPTTEPVPHRHSVVAGIVVDMKFVKSLAGLLKIVEWIFSVVVAICVGLVGKCPNTCAPVNFMQFVAISAIIFTTILIIVYALALQPKIPFIYWPLTDLINCIAFFVLYLIASSILAANTFSDSDKAAIAFGFFCTTSFAVSTWLAYKAFSIDRRKRNSPVSHIKGEHTEAQELA